MGTLPEKDIGRVSPQFKLHPLPHVMPEMSRQGNRSHLATGGGRDAPVWQGQQGCVWHLQGPLGCLSAFNGRRANGTAVASKGALGHLGPK